MRGMTPSPQHAAPLDRVAWIAGAAVILGALAAFVGLVIAGVDPVGAGASMLSLVTTVAALLALLRKLIDRQDVATERVDQLHVKQDAQSRAIGDVAHQVNGELSARVTAIVRAEVRAALRDAIHDPNSLAPDTAPPELHEAA